MMKKNAILLTLGFLQTFVLNAQFVAPTWTPAVYPATTQFIHYQPPVHTSNFGMKQAFTGSTDNLYTYSWNDSGPFGSSSNAIVAWMRTNAASTAIIQKGMLPDIIKNFEDVNVGLFRINGNPYLVVAYYDPNSNTVIRGHYLKIYQWTASGPAIMTTMQLSNAQSYGRISLDIYSSIFGDIVWQEGNQIKIKQCYYSGGALTNFVWGPTKTISNAVNGLMPDVAIMHEVVPGQPINNGWVRIVYVDPNTQTFVVSHAIFNDLMLAGSTINFIVDDNSNPAPVPYLTTPQSQELSSKLRIACPPTHIYDNWAYVYQDGNSIMTRLVNKSVSTTPNNYNLTGGMFGVAINTVANTFPTVAYDNNQTSIYFGWTSAYSQSLVNPMGQLGYVAVKLNENGTSIGQYRIVPNTSVLPVAPMAFAKQTNPIAYEAPLPHLFCFYPGVEPLNIVNMNLKFIPWGSPSFKGAPATGIGNGLNLTETISAYPNPATDKLYVTNNSSKAFMVMDMMGKILLNGTSVKDYIDVGGLAPGFYMLKIGGEAIKFTKQ